MKINTLTDALRFFLLTGCFFIVFQNQVFSQTFQDKKITIIEEQISLSSLIEKIEEKSGLFFTYSSDFLHDRFLKVTFVNRPVSYIIDQVFSKDFGYLINGREVILYKKQVMVDDTGSQHKTMPPVSPKQVPDEPAIVIKYDTIFTTRFDTVIFTRSDTVFVRDTTVLKDTVYVPKLKKAPSGKKISFKNTRFSGKNRPLSVSFHVALMVSGFGFEGGNTELVRLYKESFDKNRNFLVGFTTTYHQKAWFFESGLALTSRSADFHYSYSKPPHSEYVIDTLDSYYTLSGPDTTWFYVTDTTTQWVPGIEKNMAADNQIRMMEIPLLAGYQFPFKRGQFDVAGGIHPGIIISKRGYYIEDAEFHQAISLRELKKESGYLMASLQFRGNYELTSRISLQAYVQYKYAVIKPWHTALPVKVNWNQWNFGAGLRFSL